MPYVSNVVYNENIIPMVDESGLIPDENIFSVLVGNNGSGKSSILRDITRSLSDSSSEPAGSESAFPKKIIAVSTSPFDRFPMFQSKNRYEATERYNYIGMKNSGGRSSAIALISKATIGLISSFNQKNSSLLNVFECMHLAPKITINWRPLESTRQRSLLTKSVIRKEEEYDLRISKITKDLQSLDAISTIELLSDFKSYFHQDDIHQIASMDQYELRALREALEIIQVSGWEENVPSLELNFTNGRMYFSGSKSNYQINHFEHLTFSEEKILDAIKILAVHNILQVNDIKISRYGNGDEISLRRASSGEQCMLVIMLGIAGYLENNSVVLIDEPEISMHPEWQEQFIDLLINSFSEYQGCHFIIATHSPQIVSKLNRRNSFVTNLLTRKIFSSEYFSMKSSDFQLAEIFDAPGIKNEYIIRICFELISKLRTDSPIDSDFIYKFSRLQQLKTKIHKDDPVGGLIFSVEELRQYYADN